MSKMSRAFKRNRIIAGILLGLFVCIVLITAGYQIYFFFWGVPDGISKAYNSSLQYVTNPQQLLQKCFKRTNIRYVVGAGEGQIGFYTVYDEKGRELGINENTDARVGEKYEVDMSEYSCRTLRKADAPIEIM